MCAHNVDVVVCLCACQVNRDHCCDKSVHLILQVTVFVLPFCLYLIDSRDTDSKWFGDVVVIRCACHFLGSTFWGWVLIARSVLHSVPIWYNTHIC